MLEKCVVTVLELNCSEHLGHKRTKLNISHHMLTSSTQLQNRSFYICKICKFEGFLLLSSMWLLKLPNREFKIYDATVAKTSLKIASSSFSDYSVIMSVCLTFES